jgi:8-oxoguanine deaminase
VKHSIINGRVVVRDGELTTLELPVLVERHNRLARELAEAAYGAR